MLNRPMLLRVLVLFCLLAEIGVAVAQASDPEWATPAELASYRSTPSYAETLAYLERLASHSPKIHLDTFGRSASGRALPLVVVSANGHFSAAAARRSGQPILLIQSGIHAGEIDGKDATLELLRDIALERRPELIRGVILLIIPIYNVDGHERVSPHNRPNQDGPVEGMGFRTTAAGLDLNRDHLKAESVEARALLRLVADWQPDLHVDNHVTDGSDHAWVLTWSWVEAPQIHPAIDHWLRANLPPALARVTAAGYPTGPYAGLNDRNDPARGFSSWVGEPRYSGGYFPLRHRPSILVEMHSYKPYRQRVGALAEFLRALVSRLSSDGAALRRAILRARDETKQRGAAQAEPSQIVVSWQQQDTGDTIRWPVYRWQHRPSKVLGVPLLHYQRGELLDPVGLEVPWIHIAEAVLTLPRPRGYLILPGWPAIEQRLAAHGLEWRRIEQPCELEAELAHLSEPQFAPLPYQGRHRVEAFEVERSRRRLQVPAGALWVPADQPDFEVAVQLLEPEAPDSLLAWGFLSSVFERKEYIESRVLEGLVDDLLGQPEQRQAWQQALADEDFAADPFARWAWWYQRTVFWDDTVGLLPILRVLDVPPALQREQPTSGREG